MRVRATEFLPACREEKRHRDGGLHQNLDSSHGASDPPEKSQTLSTIFFLSQSLRVQSCTSMPTEVLLDLSRERLSFISVWIRVVLPLPTFPTTMSFMRWYGTAFFSRCCRNLRDHILDDSSRSPLRTGGQRAELGPDDVLRLAADQLEVQLEAESVQRQVPQPAQLAHLVREGVQLSVPTHIQRVQSLQQADLGGDLRGEGASSASVLVLITRLNTTAYY